MVTCKWKDQAKQDFPGPEVMPIMLLFGVKRFHQQVILLAKYVLEFSQLLEFPVVGPCKQMDHLFFYEKNLFSGSLLFLSEINLVRKGGWVGQVSDLKAVLCRKKKCLAYLCFWCYWDGSTMLCFVWYK